MKSRKVFLKRNKVADVHLRDLFVGAAVNLFARQFNITGYADDFTRGKIGARQEKTYAMIKPDAVARAGLILEAIEAADLTICNLKMLTLTRQNAEGAPAMEGAFISRTKQSSMRSTRANRSSASWCRS